MGGIARHPTLATGLIGFWSMRKGPYDDTGNGHDASIISTPVRNASGLPLGARLGITPRNNGYENNSQTEGLAVPANAAFETNKVGVAGWIFPHNVAYGSGDGRIIISKMSDGSYFQWALRTKASKLEFGCKIGGTIYWATGGTTLQDNVWYHVAGDYDGTNIRVYLNGVQDGIYNQVGTIDSDAILAVRIGARMGNGRSTTTMAYGHDGYYTNFGVWDREFTSQELTDLNIGSPYGGDSEMRGYKMYGPWYRTPYPAHPDEGWWEFDGSTDALRLPGTDKEAALFNPSQVGNSFTVAGKFAPDGVAAGDRALFAKFNKNGVDKRSWIAYQDGTDFKLAVSKNGTAAGMTEIVASAVLSAATDSFFCGRYLYDGDGSSELDLDVDGTTASSSSAVGPVYSTEDADVQVGDFDDTSDGFFDGKVYWLAFWNRVLPDAAVAAMRQGWIDPMELFPDFYIGFGQAVKTIYVPEYFKAPASVSYFEIPEFDVEGSPSTGGVRKPSYIMPVGTWRWKCFGLGERLQLAAAKAADMNPAGDFTVMARLRTILNNSANGIVGKWGVSGQYGWMLYRTTSYWRFYTSSTGADNDIVQKNEPNIKPQNEYEIAGRYIHASSDKDLYTREVGGSSYVTNKTWSGPVHASTDDLKIGDYTTDDSYRSDMDLKYFAYFDEAISDDLMAEWQAGRINPWELDPLCYLSGGHPGASYEAEMGTGTNLPYNFSAENGALRGGPAPMGSELGDDAIGNLSVWVPNGIPIGVGEYYPMCLGVNPRHVLRENRSTGERVACLDTDLDKFLHGLVGVSSIQKKLRQNKKYGNVIITVLD